MRSCRVTSRTLFQRFTQSTTSQSSRVPATTLRRLCDSSVQDAIFYVELTSSCCLSSSSEFTQGAGTQEAHDNTMKVAKGLAAVALRVLTDSSFADAAKKEYEQHRKRK